MRVSVLAVLVLAGVLLAASHASGAQALTRPVKAVYNIDGLRVTVVQGFNPDYVIKYCGFNYIDFDPSNDPAANPPVSKPTANPAIKNPQAPGILASLLSPYASYLAAPNSHGIPFAHIDRDAGRIEIMLKPGLDDPNKVALKIAYDIAPHLRKLGARELVVYIGVSNATFNDATVLFHKLVDLFLKANSEDPSRLPTLLRKALASGNWTIGLSPYGMADIHLDGRDASPAEIEELVRWIRDHVGTCNVPIYFYMNGFSQTKVALSDLHQPIDAESSSQSQNQARTTNNPVEEALAIFAAPAIIAAAAALQALRAKA